MALFQTPKLHSWKHIICSSCFLNNLPFQLAEQANYAHYKPLTQWSLGISLHQLRSPYFFPYLVKAGREVALKKALVSHKFAGSGFSEEDWPIETKENILLPTIKQNKTKNFILNQTYMIWKMTYLTSIISRNGSWNKKITFLCYVSLYYLFFVCLFAFPKTFVIFVVFLRLFKGN